MDTFSSIPDYQKAEFVKHIEEQQMKDSLKMYNHLVQHCFEKCVMTGWNGQLSESESQCVTKCSEKFMKLTQRVGFRFTEYQAIRNNQGDQGK